MKSKLIKKIQALSDLTVENGCTEAEALSAASKMSELMTKHNISVSEITIDEADCSAIKVNTGTSQMPGWLSNLAGICARHYDARLIYTGSTVTFFGMPEDAEAGKALFKMLWGTIKLEVSTYMRSGDYLVRREYTSSRVLTNSFRIGMMIRFEQRLDIIKARRDTEVAISTGNSLVVVKEAKVDDDFDKVFPNIKMGKNHIPDIDSEALHKGHQAGNNHSFGDQLK